MAVGDPWRAPRLRSVPANLTDASRFVKGPRRRNPGRKRGVNARWYGRARPVSNRAAACDGKCRRSSGAAGFGPTRPTAAPRRRKGKGHAPEHVRCPDATPGCRSSFGHARCSGTVMSPVVDPCDGSSGGQVNGAAVEVRPEREAKATGRRSRCWRWCNCRSRRAPGPETGLRRYRGRRSPFRRRRW